MLLLVHRPRCRRKFAVTDWVIRLPDASARPEVVNATRPSMAAGPGSGARWAYTIVIWNCTVTGELRDSAKIDTVRDKSESKGVSVAGFGSFIKTEPEKYLLRSQLVLGIPRWTSVIRKEIDTPWREG